MISIDLQAVQSDTINWQALVNKTLAGERVVILRSGVEVANISPSNNVSYESGKPEKRQFGFMQGDITYPDDINLGDNEGQSEAPQQTLLNIMLDSQKHGTAFDDMDVLPWQKKKLSGHNYFFT